MDAGEPVVVIDNLSTGVIDALPRGVPLEIADIGNGDLLTRVLEQHRVDSIIHFAGSRGSGQSRA